MKIIEKLSSIAHSTAADERGVQPTRYMPESQIPATIERSIFAARQPMKNRNRASVIALSALAFFAALLPASARAQAKPATEAEIVARVNNDVISLSAYQ